MPFRIVRNDITKMKTEAIVNTANQRAIVGTGCDCAIYKAAGMDELLNYRKEHIGFVEEGEVFITPGFKLTAKYIIHAVSPFYIGGDKGEEAKLRSCYRKSLQLAKENGVKSISFPLIATGGFGYPKEEGMRIAADEINAFLLGNDMEIFLVVFDMEATKLGTKIFPELEAYIDHNYVKKVRAEEYGNKFSGTVRQGDIESETYLSREQLIEGSIRHNRIEEELSMKESVSAPMIEFDKSNSNGFNELWDDEYGMDELNNKLNERLAHKSDTYSEYLMYLIESKGMKNSEVYNRAVVDKRYFSKIKNNKDFHPDKLKALCLCVGAKLSIDETKDLLARAGYALSPSNLTDIIFSFYIEYKHYDVIDIDIQLEEHGLPCIIT